MPSINKIDSDIILNLKIVARGNLLKTIGVIINAQTKKIPITKYHFKFIKPQINKFKKKPFKTIGLETPNLVKSEKETFLST